MTENEIQRLLMIGSFPSPSYLVIPNVSFGFIKWEADLLVLTNENYLIEVEIKVSESDLKIDAKKRKHVLWNTSDSERIKYFYYAMPIEIWEKVENNPPIPEYAGVIIINQYAESYLEKIKYIRPAIANKNAKDLTIEDRFKFARLGALRFMTKFNDAFVKPSNSTEIWTRLQLDLLTQYYAESTIEELVALIQKKQIQIYNKAFELSLRKSAASELMLNQSINSLYKKVFNRSINSAVNFMTKTGIKTINGNITTHILRG